ncbi:hypothetical protein LTR62_002260 [Meristemomyces frigidus]|uniref:Enoyl-CoA hydratase n=1 Tax=Meristemomyces frigidus TaxID=1508187 RepID=A0AAN7TMF1_9PEZI|nr:hypothetical protein LTR62_002260 [Meristemomyces frigidus]
MLTHLRKAAGILLARRPRGLVQAASWPRLINIHRSALPLSAVAGPIASLGQNSASVPCVRTRSKRLGHTGKVGVHVEIKEHSPGCKVATLTISNPAKLNIVNTSILKSIVTASQQLSHHDDLRAVVLTGGPTTPGKAPSFIGGMDITEMHQLSSPNEARALITHVHAACQALRNVPVPVIARVNGYTLGAGLEIMASCDLRICTANSTFAMPEVAIGIPSVVEAALLPGLIGMGRTRRLLYLAESLDGRTAERWGLVEKVVEDGAELDAAVSEWTERLCRMGALAIRNQKRLMLKWENRSVEDGIEAGVGAFADAFADGGVEPRTLMRRFVDRDRKSS